MDAFQLARPDQGADLGVVEGRVSDIHRPAPCAQTFGDLAGDALFREHPLYRDADLAGVVEAALGQ